MARPKAQRIKEAAEIVNLSLTAEEAAKLESGESLKLDEGMIKPLAKCKGLRIIDLGGGCGVYLSFPWSISVCCET